MGQTKGFRLKRLVLSKRRWNVSAMTVLPLLLITMVRASAYDSLCTARTTHADPSLYCVPLLSTDLTPSASGIAILRLASSPFGLAVTRDGRPRYRVELTL